MKHFAFAAAGLVALSAFTLPADAQVRRGGAHGDRGAVAGQVHDRTGPRGSEIKGARGAITDGQGNAAAGAINCARTPNVAGCRAGATTRTADGTVTHKSGIAVQGDTRSLTSQGGFTKSTEGGVDQGRTTTATGENGSVAVTGTYNTTDGRSRTVTCSDASGAVVACPQH